MRAARCWIWCLSWLALCAAPAAQAARPCVDKPKQPAKASSFAPHSSGHNHVYGTPIQKPILKYRPKPKPQLKSEAQKSDPQLKGEPQLKSEPLPQA